MIDHEEISSKTCSECITTEKHSTKSARKYINRDVKRDHYKIDSLNKLDYRPDNLCNLKCRMCSMHSSSLIEEEFLANGWDPIEKQNTLDVMDFDLSELKTLALLGGEPTVNKRMFPILDFFIENNMTDSVKLNYTTNCTSINKPWMSRAEKFKDININLSIDAYGKLNEFIRKGCNWNEIITVMDFFHKLYNERDSNTVIQVHSAVGVYNANMINDLESFVKENYPRFNTTQQMIQYPVYLNLQNMPQDYKELIEPYVNEETKKFMYGNILNNYFDHFVNFHNKLNNIRKENFLYNPLLEDYINKHKTTINSNDFFIEQIKFLKGEKNEI